MNVNVYTGDGYNAFTDDTHTGCEVFDAATGKLVAKSDCYLKTDRNNLTLESIKRAVQSIKYLHVDSATIYSDSSTAVNEIRGAKKNPKHSALVTEIHTEIEALNIPVKVRYTDFDRTALGEDIAEAARYFETHTLTDEEFFGY